MEALSQDITRWNMTSPDFAENLLTSPGLSRSCHAARERLLEDFYHGTICNRSVWDIISLAKQPFYEELAAERERMAVKFDVYGNKELAAKMYQASAGIADFLGLDFDEAFEEQKNMTAHGRSPLDGVAILLVLAGSSETSDQVPV